MTFAEWLPATAGRDIACFCESEESRASDVELFLVPSFFHLSTFLPDTGRLVFLTS